MPSALNDGKGCLLQTGAPPTCHNLPLPSLVTAPEVTTPSPLPLRPPPPAVSQASRGFVPPPLPHAISSTSIVLHHRVFRPPLPSISFSRTLTQHSHHLIPSINMFFGIACFWVCSLKPLKPPGVGLAPGTRPIQHVLTDFQDFMQTPSVLHITIIRLRLMLPRLLRLYSETQQWGEMYEGTPPPPLFLKDYNLGLIGASPSIRRS